MATKRGTGATAPNGAQYVIQVDETGTIISGGVLGTVSITGTVIPTGAASTDKSIASATGSSQTIVAANTSRKQVFIQNIDVVDWWIDPRGGTAAANTAGSYKLAPGATMTIDTLAAITGIAASGSKLSALEQ